MSFDLAGGVRHPKIYAYTTDLYVDTVWVGSREGNGLIKVGYTTRDDVEVRISEQLRTGVKMPTEPKHETLLVETAVTDTGQTFMDHEIHAVLERSGVRRVEGEWFECTADEVQAAITAVKTGVPADGLRPRAVFEMRPEQQTAVNQTATYFEAHADVDHPPHFLWNAKMRFGKTFTAYQLARHMGWTRVLVLTYKPAVESAWRDDLENHADFDGWRFKSKNDPALDFDDPAPAVWFASFQDVLGKDKDGNPKIRNENLYLIEWDAVIIDEYHFGAWRDAAKSLYTKDPETGISGDASEKKAVDSPDLEDGFAENIEEALQLTVGNYLYLSGTPFRALTQGEFLEDQVFNWTYSDEQKAKRDWPKPAPNLYAALPKMHLLVYDMPDKLREVAINNQSEFSLTEFFRTEQHGTEPSQFVHVEEIQRWLDLLRGQDLTELWAHVSNRARPPLPFEDTNLLRALQHTIWYMPGVDACTAMAGLLHEQHNTFYRDYKVIVAAGPKAGMGAKAQPPVDEAIGQVPQDTKTITLTCGKLMTGVTVPAWTGIFMLRELKSPETYFQAAFRVQSPWTSTTVDTTEGGRTEIVHKEHCYVLDFSPNRALRQIVDYATRLRVDTPAGFDPETAIDEFMEFLPVLSFDGYSMSELHASDVIDFLTAGISSSMLARRWNSPELLTLDMVAMRKLLDDPELLASLENIEQFRNITNDLEAMISSNKEVAPKKLAKEGLSKDEKKRKTDADKRRATIKQRLQHLITRVPAFMYLTDDREKTIRDIITQMEPGLFEKVTSLSLHDFGGLIDAGVFNDAKMNDAVWKFRMFEEPSLRYGPNPDHNQTSGGWNVIRNKRFAALIDADIIKPGDLLTATTNPQITATVTDDYGISYSKQRYESPDDAAAATTGDTSIDGWDYWTADTPYGPGTLTELATLTDDDR